MKRRITDKSAFSFVEMLVGAGILTIILGIVATWFYTQKQMQNRITRIVEIRENTRLAFSRMLNELRFSRQIIWPVVNSDHSPKSDSVMIFKNFKGNIICYYHDEVKKEIRRCMIPYDTGDPYISPKPVGVQIASASFTAIGDDQKLVSIYLSTDGVHQIDAVRLEND
ncbi:MAG: type II secretion system protein [Candidatus Riflebacteria bacterium]|nr:type II secretion system protein [Candidatus Riflebacteria bacterium]